MVAQQMSEYLQDQISHWMNLVLDANEHKFSKEDIWHDFAQLTPDSLKACFYIKTIENVKRKPFVEAVEKLKQDQPALQILKVKSKRPNSNVRFEILVQRNTNAA